MTSNPTRNIINSMSTLNRSQIYLILLYISTPCCPHSESISSSDGKVLTTNMALNLT